MNPLCHETEKKCFPSRLHAEVRILDIERKSDHPLYSYLCEHCGRWHLTKTPHIEALIEINLK